MQEQEDVLTMDPRLCLVTLGGQRRQKKAAHLTTVATKAASRLGRGRIRHSPNAFGFGVWPDSTYNVANSHPLCASSKGWMDSCKGQGDAHTRQFSAAPICKTTRYLTPIYVHMSQATNKE